MIYAIEAVGSGFVKFGFAGKDAGDRLRAMQTGCPHELAVRATAEWPDSVEFRIHQYLADVHHRGEWFRIGPEADAVIQAMIRGRFEDWHELLTKSMPARLRHHIKPCSLQSIG